MNNIKIAKHSNLRNDRWSFHVMNDDRHFDQLSIGRLAKNMKIVFRKAAGLSVFEKKNVANGGRKYVKRQPKDGLVNMSNVDTFKKKLMSFLESC